MNQLLWAIPLLPLAGFAVNALFRLPKTAAGIVGCAGPAAAFLLSVAAWLQGPVQQAAFDWFTVGESLRVSFALRVDALSSVMILVVTGVGTLIHVYSVAYMHEDEGFSRFFAYLNLFMFSMLVLVLGDSLVLLFLGWEGVGLCSYLLIGFWYKDLKNADAGKKAFITNRVGDLGFLLGMFCLWQIFGTLDVSKMAAAKAGTILDPHPLAAAAGLLLFVGACGKSAQIPLYVWLPDAMAGPTPVSALIHAATMVTAGVYMMARMHFLYAVVPGVQEIVAGVAALTALVAGVIAVAQNDIKKVLAYSTVSQLGFMFVGVAVSDNTAGLFHVVTHAFFKALLFLGAGAVIHSLGGEQDIRKMGGLGKELKGVFAVFAVGALALAGCPFTAGFYSKDMILESLLAKGWSGIFLVMWGTAALTAFYTTRLVICVFLGRNEHPRHVHAPGLVMMAPLYVLAALSLAGGFLLEHPIDGFLGKLWGGRPHGPHGAAVALSIAAFGCGAALAGLMFHVEKGWLKAWMETPVGRGLHRAAENKFWVDEIYEVLILAPIKTSATVFWFLVDRLLIDALLVGGTGKLAYAAGWVFRRPHTGSVNMALVSFLVGALAVLGILVVRLAG
jgi:NADH-quinone oxidoreductase subunit L